MAGSQTNEAPNEPRLQVGVILASVREGRRGETFANWILSMLQARPGVTAELLDLKEWPLPGYAFKDAPTVGEKSYESGSLAGRWRDRIAAEDAILVVTPEYNHSFSGALKNALDHLQVPWHHKPIAFVSYGGFAAGTRAVEHLRQVAIELRMVPIRDEVNLRLVGLAVDERGWPKDDLYAKKAAAMIDDLLWWTRVTKDGRARYPR